MAILFILTTLTSGILGGCRSVNTSTTYTFPTYAEQRPERPLLDASDDVLQNFYKVAGYAKKLEVYTSSLEEYLQVIIDEVQK